MLTSAFYWIAARWSELPTWAKWVFGIGGLFLLQAALSALGEKSIVAATAENFVAYVFQYGSVVGGIAAGLWVGTRLLKRTRSNLLSWTGGIAAAVFVGTIVYGIGGSIPGVAWRLERMALSDCSTDWDGRSNPLACD